MFEPVSRSFFFQAEDGIRDHCVTGVQTCALPIYPQKLMRAGRTLATGDGVVLLGTVRMQESFGGATAALALYSVALACGPTNLDLPGDLKGCKGYLMRVTRQWPAEVYALEEATVSLIPEGGTARGRMRAQSVPS